MPKPNRTFNERISELASHGPALHIHNVRKVEDSLFRVWMVTAGTRDAFDQETMAAHLQRAVGAEFRVLPASVGPRVSPGAREPVYSALVVPNLAVKLLPKDITEAGLTLITANLFRDAEDQLWRRVVSDGLEQIVQTSKTDFEEILATRRSMATPPLAFASTVKNSSSGAQPGNWVSYYDTARRGWSQGYLFATAEGTLAVANEEKMEEVDPDQVVEYDDELHIPEIAAATPGKADYKTVIEYIKKLYGANSTVYQRLKAMIEQRNALAG